MYDRRYVELNRQNWFKRAKENQLSLPRLLMALYVREDSLSSTALSTAVSKPGFLLRNHGIQSTQRWIDRR